MTDILTCLCCQQSEKELSLLFEMSVTYPYLTVFKQFESKSIKIKIKHTLVQSTAERHIMCLFSSLLRFTGGVELHH